MTPLFNRPWFLLPLSFGSVWIETTSSRQLYFHKSFQGPTARNRSKPEKEWASLLWRVSILNQPRNTRSKYKIFIPTLLLFSPVQIRKWRTISEIRSSTYCTATGQCGNKLYLPVPLFAHCSALNVQRWILKRDEINASMTWVGGQPTVD